MAAHRPPPGGTIPESASETPDCQTRVDSLKYILSKKQKTPSFQLSARGYWSTWPAFGCGQTILGNHKPCCAPEGREASNKQALLTIPKPQYLEELESYLKKELQSLDLTEKNAQELKLQPYREIFEFFIDNFKTYKPLLSAIKNEYEITLAHQKKIIRSLEPLKAMVTTVSEECTQRILALQEKEKDEIYLLKQEKQHLLKLVDNLKEEKCSLQTQVEYLQASLTEEFTRYLNQHDAHKLLLAKLNEMHQERLDTTRRQAQDVKGEDVVKLTLALKVARQDLTKAQVKLNKMIADYGDVVPRRDFESLEKKYSDLLQEMNVVRKDFDRLHEEYETLLEIHRETEQERDNLCTELQRVQQNHTPRPDWEKCSEVIAGGAERWEGLAQGRTSEQLVDVLLEEIGTAALKEINVFPGWGKGGNVPVYLRHGGDVKNKKLTKKDVVNILKDIWKEKIALEEQTGKKSSLPEFFLSYLQKKFGDAAAMEWSYNLYENMRVCPSNHVLSSFYAILTGKVGEEQYHSQKELISSLQKELAACDRLSSGSLTNEQFSTALREAFPLKRKESIQELVDASRYRLDGTEETINYTALFEEDEEGNTTPFVAKLRSQHVREKQEHLRRLKDKPGDLTVTQLVLSREVNTEALKAAFCSTDPSMDPGTPETYLGLALGAGGEELEQGATAVETAPKRLLRGGERSGTRARGGSTSPEGE